MVRVKVVQTAAHEVPFTAHEGQREICESDARFRDVCCGRRFGKTRLVAAECLAAARRSYPHGRSPRVWLVAPTFKVGNEAWDLPGGILDLGKNVMRKVHRTDRRYWVKGGGLIELRTADREDNLRGGGLDFLAIDEAGMISERAWRALRPTVSDRGGRVLRAGTPRGRNWWYREWKKGQPGPDGDPDYRSWQMSSNTSPYFSSEEWGAARGQLPADWFRQEYEAEFLESMAAVFRGLERCLVPGEGIPPRPGEKYVHGLDIAKQQDWSVLVTVALSSGRVCHLKRLQRVEYLQQAEIFAEVVRRYPGPVWADASGVGPALIEPLGERGASVSNYLFTEERKRRLVGNLIVGVESGAVRIPTGGEFAVLVGEMRDFEYKLSLTGQPRYGAPASLHDDCVYSLALAWWGLAHGGAAFTRQVYYQMN